MYSEICQFLEALAKTKCPTVRFFMCVSMIGAETLGEMRSGSLAVRIHFSLGEPHWAAAHSMKCWAISRRRFVIMMRNTFRANSAGGVLCLPGAGVIRANSAGGVLCLPGAGVIRKEEGTRSMPKRARRNCGRPLDRLLSLEC